MIFGHPISGYVSLAEAAFKFALEAFKFFTS